MTNKLEIEALNNSELEASVEQQTGEQIISKSLDDIDIVETRVTSELGIERGTAEAVKVTDEALVDIANYELNSDDFTAEERRDVVEDVVIESAVELAHGATPDQTALFMFDASKHPGEISQILDTLNETHATLPNGAEAAPLVMEAIAELSGRVDTYEPFANIEFSTNNEAKAETMDAATERAERAAAAGIERSNFDGPEVREAIHSYYTDHEVALSTIEAIANGTLSEADKKQLLQSNQATGNSNESIFAAALEKSLKLDAKANITGRNFLLTAALKDIYKEPCIGQQTLDEAAIDEIANRKVAAEKLLSPYSRGDDDSRIENEKLSMMRAQEAAKNETRDAGQLLFHNTLHGNDVITNGTLQGRHQQQEIHGKVNLTAGDIEGHSVLAHWSETYDPIGYKQEVKNNSVVEQAMAVTIAVPLGEMVKQAPYARGLEYATVGAKQDRAVQTASVGHENAPITGEIGPGSADTVGRDHASIDRVFWASTDSLEEGAAYDVKINGADIMKRDPLSDVEMPVVYAIQSDSDRLRGYNHMNKNIQPDKLDTLIKDTKELSQRELTRKYGQGVDSVGSGAGYGYANRVNIEDIRLSTQSSADQWLNGGADMQLRGSDAEASFEVQAANAEPYIRAIEKESIERFEGTYVVPLRAAIMKFNSNTGDNSVSNQYGQEMKESVARVDHLN